jgi:hypothetical protein
MTTKSSVIIETSCLLESEEMLHMMERWNLEVEYIRDMEKLMFIASFKNQAHYCIMKRKRRMKISYTDNLFYKLSGQFVMT